MGVVKVVTKPIGCLLKILLPIIIIIALVVAAFFVVINLTPEKIGLADTEIYDGKTLRDMGLADFKLKDIYTYLKNLTSPDESQIVTNKPTEEDKTAAEGNTAGSSLTTKEDGSTDFSAAISGKVTYDGRYALVYEDTTLAYIFSQLVTDAGAQTQNSDNESIKFLSDLGANFEEVTIKDLTNGTEGTTANLRLVASISLASIKSQIDGAIPDILKRFVKIPDKVYVVSYLGVTVDEEGVLTCTSQNIKINDEDSVLTNAIFSVLAKNAGAEGDEDTKAAVNRKIGEGFSYFVSNLGLVGAANTEPATYPAPLEEGEYTLGSVGLMDGGLKLITHVQEAEEPEVPEA